MKINNVSINRWFCSDPNSVSVVMCYYSHAHCITFAVRITYHHHHRHTCVLHRYTLLPVPHLRALRRALLLCTTVVYGAAGLPAHIHGELMPTPRTPHAPAHLPCLPACIYVPLPAFAWCSFCIPSRCHAATLVLCDMESDDMYKW